MKTPELNEQIDGVGYQYFLAYIKKLIRQYRADECCPYFLDSLHRNQVKGPNIFILAVSLPLGRDIESEPPIPLFLKTPCLFQVDGLFSVVSTLTLGHQSVGIYQDKSRAVYWNGRNESGGPVASGVYFYTLSAGDFTATRKMLIRK